MASYHSYSGASGGQTRALAKRADNPTYPFASLSSVNDSALRDALAALSQSHKRLIKMDSFIRKSLALPKDRQRGLLVRLISFMVPKTLYPILPQTLVERTAEESDALVSVGSSMRRNVDNAQDALCELGSCASEGRQALNSLEADIRKAKEENWDAQRLQQYMADRAGIQIYDIIAKLLNFEFDTLSGETKEERKQALLDQLESAVVIIRSLMGTVDKACSVGLGVLHKLMVQYFLYTNFCIPVAVIRDSAITMLDSDGSLYAAKDALLTTLQEALTGLEYAADAASMVDRYTLASTDMDDVLKAGQERLNEKLKALQAVDGRALVIKQVRQLKSAAVAESSVGAA